jgi:hypothetical protein
MKISDGFKFEIGQFMARITISLIVLGLFAGGFLLASLAHFFGLE